MIADLIALLAKPDDYVVMWRDGELYVAPAEKQPSPVDSTCRGPPAPPVQRPIEEHAEIAQLGA